MFKRYSVLALVLVGALSAASCGSGGIASGNSVTLDQEWQLGDQMAAQVSQQMQLVRDPTALAELQRIGERLHRATPLADRRFDFEIVNDPSVNAFAIPGGHVYVNSGLLAHAEKEDELAGVLAHEINHVVARHVIKQMEQQQMIGALGSILLGQNPGAVQQILAQVVAGGAMARFSRADEKEADDMGLQTMTQAGYDPHGMLDMFSRLLALDKGGDSSVARFFADHPGTQDRINDISSRIAKMGNPTGTVDTPSYHSNLRDRVSR
jgi:predicted Zn-dependent protease